MTILTDNALQVFTPRYALTPEEDWEGSARRVGTEIAIAEPYDLRQFYGEKYAEMIYNMLFMPGGRILRNAGRPRGSMLNCYGLLIGDSREEIGDFYKESLIVWGEGGGSGINISSLRPRGAPIRGVGGNSSGPVSFLIASDAIAETIESGGSRRAAALALMIVEHPDIMEFINAKLTDGLLPHYNISVGITEDFLTKVETEDEWEFKFAQQTYGKMPALEIWNTIIENMVKCAEPGILNWDKVRSNNSYYFAPISTTNPCGEAVLEPYGACDLGSIVLPKFVGPGGNTSWKRLADVIYLGVRFLDDVLDVNKYVLHNIDLQAHSTRRVGLGVLGLADYLFAKQIRYGSEHSIREIERLMRFIRDTAYEASVKLAIEKGAFPKFDPVMYGKAHFIRTLPASLRMDIKQNGTRNVTLMAVAPTGTISLVADCTSGIEPLPMKAYVRSDRVSDRPYIHPIYKDILNSNEKIPEWFVDSHDLKPEEHFEVQAAVQKFTDGAVSKTINLPKRTTSKDLSKLMLEYVYDLKGVTVYVDGSREGQILNPITRANAKKLLKEEEVTHEGGGYVDCHTGTCGI